jgi:hypothetical protein
MGFAVFAAGMKSWAEEKQRKGGESLGRTSPPGPCTILFLFLLVLRLRPVIIRSDQQLALNPPGCSRLCSLMLLSHTFPSSFSFLRPLYFTVN